MDQVSVSVPPHGVTVEAMIASLAADHPALAPVLPHCRFARNGTYVRGRGARLRPGDELAVHPPYSGG
jgi:molybdopterin converting factor small subunit